MNYAEGKQKMIERLSSFDFEQLQVLYYEAEKQNAPSMVFEAIGEAMANVSEEMLIKFSHEVQ